MTEEYQRLYRQLLDDPERFEARGDGNALLKEHFDGVPVDTLRPLLRHRNSSVRGTAMFVVNELGKMAVDLVDDVIPLIADSDTQIQWDALESVMVCSNDTYLDRFIYVIRELENSNSSICRLAMRLVSNANHSQLEAGIRFVDKLQPRHTSHKRGLSALLNWQAVSNVEVVELLNDPDDLIKKYGAIVAMRRMDQSPELIQHAVKSENEFVSRFAKESVE